MTALVLHSARRQRHLLLRRRARLGLSALVAIGAGLAAMSNAPVIDAGRAAAAIIPPAEARQLVAATSGTASQQFQAVGEKAEVINASIPFSRSPLEAARPFMVSGDGLDRRRALLCMTQAVYYEAGFEPAAGRRAVAQVVLNRMRHPAFPKSVCGVVYQGSRSPVCQFSFVCDGSLYRRPALSAWKEAEAIAAAALAGYVERSVGEATHYHADYVAPRWAPLLAKIEKIGAHIFYRWPGAWGRSAAFTGRYIGEPNDPLALRPPLRVAEPGENNQLGGLTPVDSGPPVPRAANDVGGLLDTSKGWTLHIPMPSESGSAQRAIASRQGEEAAPALAPADPAPPTVVAAR